MVRFNAPRPRYRWQRGLLLLSLPRGSYRAACETSRRAARTSVCRIQPEMLAPASSAAWRISSSCSGSKRMRRDSECVLSAFGLAIPIA